jgi:hypothetical protein
MKAIIDQWSAFRPNDGFYQFQVRVVVFQTAADVPVGTNPDVIDVQQGIDVFLTGITDIASLKAAIQAAVLGYVTPKYNMTAADLIWAFPATVDTTELQTSVAAVQSSVDAVNATVTQMGATVTTIQSDVSSLSPATPAATPTSSATLK